MTALPTPATTRPTAIVVLRWLARLLSLASLVMLAMFAFGPLERARPTAGEWLLLAFFPIGVALGLIVAWWREILGGVISIASLAIFYAIMLANSGNVRGPYFLLFSAPALLFLMCGLMSRSRDGRVGPRAL